MNLPPPTLWRGETSPLTPRPADSSTLALPGWGCAVSGLWFRVSGFGRLASGLGFGVWGFGFWGLGGWGSLGLGIRVPGSCFLFSVLVSGFWLLVWFWDSGFWFLV